MVLYPLKYRIKQIVVQPKDSSRQTRALQGTFRSLINNMVKGVVTPYSKDLLIEGVGFRAAVKGNDVGLELGYSHPINHPIPQGVSVTVADNVKFMLRDLISKKWVNLPLK